MSCELDVLVEDLWTMWGMPHSPSLYGNWMGGSRRVYWLWALLWLALPWSPSHRICFWTMWARFAESCSSLPFYVNWVQVVTSCESVVLEDSWNMWGVLHLPSLYGNWDGWSISWALIVVILTLPAFIRGILNRVARVAERCDCCLFIFCGNRGSGVMSCRRVLVLLFLLESVWPMWGMWRVPSLYGNWDGWFISCALLASILLGSLTLLTFSQDWILNHVARVAEPCNLMCFFVQIGVRWLSCELVAVALICLLEDVWTMWRNVIFTLVWNWIGQVWLWDLPRLDYQ